MNTSTIKLSYLTSALETCSARNKLLILDCCHALSEISNWRPPQSEAYRILAASGRLEKAKEVEVFRSSFLTYQIHRALTENYFDVVKNNPHLTINNLYEWVIMQARDYNSRNVETVPLPKLIGDQGHDFVICSPRKQDPPIQVKLYLNQTSRCLSTCSKECFGRYPWCRLMSELGQISSHYVIPRVKYSTDEGIISEQRLDEYLMRWLEDGNEKRLAILGDSGLGKSSACVFLFAELVNRCLRGQSSGRIPIFLSLESLAKHGLLGGDVATILNKVLHIELDPGVVDSFIRENRFVFILDGFDEISDKANHARLVRNLRDLAPILHSECKTVLTCRTHLFVNQEQVEQVLIGGTDVGTEFYTELRQQNLGFRIIELQEFSEEEIRELIGKTQNENSEEIWNTIKGLYDLEDLSKRPILLTMILQTLPRLIRHQSEKINRAEVYRAYTESWLRREAERIETDIDIKKKESFAEYLAVEMWKRHVVSLNYEELHEEIRDKYADEIASYADLYSRYYDTQNASFLNRDNDGFYRFMHKSFMEYFVAQSCVKSLRIDGKGMELWDHKWFDKEVAGFISETIQRSRYSYKINVLADASPNISKRTILWNLLHVLSLIEEENFHKYTGQETLSRIIDRAECEHGAVILRQYCRIIAKFGSQKKAQDLIRRIIEIVSQDSNQNFDNNNTYINYYYGQSSACEALLGHLSTHEPKYDRELHIYVLGEIGEKRHIERLQALIDGWKNIEHIQMGYAAIEKIRGREK